ncbi:MAG: hypothetical protein HYU63_02280 [Armatimonadetes bacterium]|nr:hypothetical protein [Armatimonadota bacterium]
MLKIFKINSSASQGIKEKWPNEILSNFKNFITDYITVTPKTQSNLEKLSDTSIKTGKEAFQTIIQEFENLKSKEKYNREGEYLIAN